MTNQLQELSDKSDSANTMFVGAKADSAHTVFVGANISPWKVNGANVVFLGA